MTVLALRPTRIGGDRLQNDFCVYCEGRNVGRIMLAENHVDHTEEWRWHINPPLPVPDWAGGAACSREQAQTQFRAAWERFHARLTPHAIAHWHQVADAASRRFGEA
jgi:hypothetical protein